ncbi:MAG: 30S ribosomal protein S3 [Elusimicrobiota bacterium]
MGQKVHPKGIRLGYINDWDSKWFARGNFADLLEEDLKIRAYIKKHHKNAGISKVGIERAGKYVRVNIHTARPGIVIGKKGSDVENLRKNMENITGRKTYVNIIEIKTPELDAQLVAEGIAMQLEKKVSYRRAMKKAMERSLKLGALGIKIMVAGRLGGAEIARTEWAKEGRTPLQTFRADIDYGFAEAYTTYGQIGVKTWIFRKEYFGEKLPDIISPVTVIGEENNNKSSEVKDDVNAQEG